MVPRVVFNGNYLSLRPTGIGQYVLNLWRCWQRSDKPLRAFMPAEYLQEPLGGHQPVKTPGHLARLVWNQTILPTRLRPGEVLFNPVPEGPLVGGLPQVTAAHDTIPLVFPELFPRKQAYFRYLVPACLRRATRILCNSEQTRADLVHFYGLDPARMTVIPLACDRERFFPRPADPRQLASYGLDADRYVLYVGSHEPHKNLARLLEAFARVAGDWPGQLAIAGACDPRYTPPLMRLAEQRGIATRVRWLDYPADADLPLLYSGAHLFVFPSLYEGFGLPVLEAMACGAAVLTSARGALAEVAGQAAVLVEPQSTQGIAAGLERLFEPKVRAKYRTLALQRAAEFSWEHTAEATWRVIEGVGSPPP
ncbi:MAG: glycosyltransferase family 4 protein [Aphanocapsa lilacina HA4352-LM1]|jgi:glycosyltransferase involved in cell wall biosynthesis|nr:glycosyltransferase family 4 protein [Aphanocapsa lilacina HA4352-LM1]